MKKTWTAGDKKCQTRKEARNVHRLEAVSKAVESGNINKAIAVVLKMIGREIMKSRS